MRLLFLAQCPRSIGRLRSMRRMPRLRGTWASTMAMPVVATVKSIASMYVACGVVCELIIWGFGFSEGGLFVPPEAEFFFEFFRFPLVALQS